MGAVGFVNAAFELKDQIEAGQCPEPDAIYAAAGTLGTVAGLTIGLDVLGMKTKIISVRVNNEDRINVPNFVKLMNDTVALLTAADPSFPARIYTPEDICLVNDYYGNDYALFTKEGMSAVKLMDKDYGITLEGTYTGKTCAALLNAVKTSKKPNEVLLFWNTLNSKVSPVGAPTDYHELPRAFWSYFETDVQELDR